MRHEQSFEKQISSLEAVFELVSSFVAQETLAKDIEFCLNFTVEEIFTNMVKYNESPRNEVLVAFERRDEQVVVELTDFDVEPFDPETAPKVDVDAPLEERTSGGLGLHLVKSMVDTLTYEYRDRNLKVTAFKGLNG